MLGFGAFAGGWCGIAGSIVESRCTTIMPQTIV
jgi:hypothetical protein